MVGSAIVLLNKHKHTDLRFDAAYPTDTGVACYIHSTHFKDSQFGEHTLKLELSQTWFQPLGLTFIDDYAARSYANLPDFDRLVARLAFLIYNLWLRPDWEQMVAHLQRAKNEKD